MTIGTTAQFQGVVLGKTLIAVNTGASVNGRLLAQTAVTLQQNTVTQPANAITPPVIKGPFSASRASGLHVYPWLPLWGTDPSWERPRTR